MDEEEQLPNFEPSIPFKLVRWLSIYGRRGKRDDY